MKIFWKDDPLRELEIEGTAVEWEAFSVAIMHPSIVIPCEVVAASAPYDRCLPRLRVGHVTGQTVEFQVTAADEFLLIGDSCYLEKLSTTARNLSRDFHSGSHIHIEYQGETHYIGRNSIPAVLSLL